MAWWFPWKRVTAAAAVPVDEVQRRLAAATADWSVEGWGSAVPSPPWTDGDFVAVKGAAGLSIFPIVVTGTVRPEGAGTRLDATIRPHGSMLLGTAAFAIFAAVNAPGSGSIGRVVFPAVAVCAYLMLLGLSREKARPVEALLKEACR
jgi:hypothetical protein